MDEERKRPSSGTDTPVPAGARRETPARAGESVRRKPSRVDRRCQLKGIRSNFFKMLKWAAPLHVEGGGGPEFALVLAHRQCPLIGRRVGLFVNVE